MKSYLKHLLTILVFFPLWINAQTFPVQAHTQVIPPYSLNISEYSTLSTEKVMLNLLLNDITESNRQVRLKLYIENNAGLSIRSNDFVIGTQPIFLDGGTPLRLSTIDLQPYFSIQNLLGITPQQYNTPLPEGLYRFCFEVYDVTSNLKISSKSCMSVYLVLNDPPFLNIPRQGEQVLIKEPQNIIFQWTPRHLNATNVSYEFTLTELWDNKMDPQAAFLATQPLFQTNTLNTILSYGPAGPSLLPDKTYGWRIRAMINDGISETSVFKNDGYSEIHYFTYTAKCAEPQYILAEAKSTTSEKIYWQGVDHIQYDVQYRKKAPSNPENASASQGSIWFNAESVNDFITINYLEPGTIYEFRVGGQCLENGPYTYSQVYEFTTPISTDDILSYNCGMTPEILITNQDPLTQLMINETFTVGDFKVVVKEISNGNLTGMDDYIPVDDEGEAVEIPTAQGFSGWGYIEVAYLEDTKIKVSFNNIKINTDYQLIEGIVETDYDKNWGGVASVNDVLDIFEGDNDLMSIDLKYDITIDDISITYSGDIAIKHPVSGNVMEYPGGDDVIIMDTNEDGSRDIFHVDADGNIREGGQIAEGGAIDPQNTAGVNSNGEVAQLTAQGIKVEFIDDTNYTYGFDQIPSGQESRLGTYYTQIKDAQGNPYNIINKSVRNGDSEVIKAKVTITDSNLSVSDLVIKTVHGENIEYEISGNEITLHLNGYYSFEHENIYVTIQPKKNNTDKQTVAGIFSLWHLANKDVNLTIIPVNGALSLSESELALKMNNIFKKASVTFNVSVASEISINKNTVAVGSSGAFSHYTGDQMGIIQKLKSRGTTNPKSYYVFVLGKDIRPSGNNAAGFMPLKRQFGFVFSSNLSQEKEGKTTLEGTLSHELGHGVFALEHPFSELGTTKGGTDWLMDYGNGMRLSHLDWAQIHNPGFKLYLFQSDEDATLTFSALTPNWMPFTYEGDGTVVFPSEIPQEGNGAVFEILEDGKLYKWQHNASNSRTSSYVHEGKSLESVDIIWTNFDDAPIQLYWNKGDCSKNELYTTTYEYIADFAPNETEKLDLNNGTGAYNGNIYYYGAAGCPNESCENLAITEETQREIDEFILISNSIKNKNYSDVSSLVVKVNRLSICVLKKLEYDTVESVLLFLGNQFNGANGHEKAIVKLMECIKVNKSTDFYNNILIDENGWTLPSLLHQITNKSFSGFSGDEENAYSSFLTTLANIVSNISNDNPKWYVFNTIIKQKYNALEETLTIVALEKLMTSLVGINEEQINKTPAILALFIDMLKDPNLDKPISIDYKVIFDIVTIRYDHRELFSKFTMTDIIYIRPVNAQREVLTNLPKVVIEIPPSMNPSWVIPNTNEIFSVYTPIIQESDLYSNYVWSRYIIDNNITIDNFTTDHQTFFDTFLTQLTIYLTNGPQDNAQFWKNLGPINCDNIIDVVIHINLNENVQSLKLVNKQTRLDFLEFFFYCNNTLTENDLTHIIEDTENSLIKTINSFDSTDESILRRIEYIGLNKIYEVLNINNFNKLTLWLGMQIMSSKNGETLALDDINLNDEDFGKSNMLQLEANIFSFQNFASKLVNSNKIKINGKNEDYNKIVLVHIAGSFTFLGQQFRQGDILLMPIIQAFAMSESNQRLVRWNSAFLTLDVASFAFGVGQAKLLFTAGNYARKAILISDLVGSGLGALATSLNQDAISSELRYQIQILSLITSAPSLFSTPNDLQKLTLTEAKSTVDEALGKLTNSNQISEASKIELQKFYGGNLSGTSVIPSRIPSDYHDLFKLDFPNPASWNNLGEEFLDGWVKYRNANKELNICD